MTLPRSRIKETAFSAKPCGLPQLRWSVGAVPPCQETVAAGCADGVMAVCIGESDTLAAQAVQVGRINELPKAWIVSHRCWSVQCQRILGLLSIENSSVLICDIPQKRGLRPLLVRLEYDQP